MTPETNSQTTLSPCISKAKLADEWSCNPATISRLIERGELEAFRVGRVIRVLRRSVDEYVSRQAIAK